MPTFTAWAPWLLRYWSFVGLSCRSRWRSSSFLVWRRYYHQCYRALACYIGAIKRPLYWPSRSSRGISMPITSSAIHHARRAVRMVASISSSHLLPCVDFRRYAHIRRRRPSIVDNWFEALSRRESESRRSWGTSMKVICEISELYDENSIELLPHHFILLNAPRVPMPIRRWRRQCRLRFRCRPRGWLLQAALHEIDEAIEGCRPIGGLIGLRRRHVSSRCRNRNGNIRSQQYYNLNRLIRWKP